MGRPSTDPEIWELLGKNDPMATQPPSRGMPQPQARRLHPDLLQYWGTGSTSLQNVDGQLRSATLGPRNRTKAFNREVETGKKLFAETATEITDRAASVG